VWRLTNRSRPRYGAPPEVIQRPQNIRCCVFARRYTDFQAVSRAYAEAFNEPYPARTFITVADLPEGVDVIIEAVAFVPESRGPSG